MKQPQNNYLPKTQYINLKTVSREHYLTLVEMSIDTGEINFALGIILNWLAEYPGDLQAQYLYSRILLQDSKPKEAMAVLERLCRADPLYTSAIDLYLQSITSFDREDNKISQIQSLLYILSDAKLGQPGEKWCPLLYQARHDLKSGLLADGIEIIEELLQSADIPDFPLIEITHIELLDTLNDQSSAPMLQLLEEYHLKYPDTLFFIIRLADALIVWGDHPRAVWLLNHAVTRDVSGQVITRLWGSNHRYHSIWPQNLSLPIESFIPYHLSLRLGWNVLPQGKTPAPSMKPEPEQLKIDAPELKQHDSRVEEVEVPINKHEKTSVEPSPMEIDDSVQPNNRVPNYVIFSVQQALEEKFGSVSAKSIIEEMHNLAQVMNQLNGWKSIVFLADDEQNAFSLGINPAKPGDPWSLKLAICDLEIMLSRKGERIGAVVIIGGPDIVPFHHLPNPVNDPDDVIPSDNPYASSDENYFIPEWSVGRLPDGEIQSKGIYCDPSELIENLRQITRNNMAVRNCTSLFRRIIIPIKNGLRYRKIGALSSYGYAAAVWQNISGTVFSPIGNPKKILSSPPYGRDKSKSITGNKLVSFWSFIRRPSNNGLKTPPRLKSNLAYFNLHGVSDSGEWFGQKDPHDPSEFPDYPIALRPEDIILPRQSAQTDLPQVVFSEACFGAHILDKVWNEAISLSLLHTGCKVFIGSTSMAYGSVGPPLIAADLLGHNFWVALNEGYPAGEALLRAKINLAQTMHNRQGHLDGEDQKTLISFVLYGDPLAFPLSSNKCPEAPWRPPGTTKEVKTITDSQLSDELPPEVVAHVKKIVSRYLPGMLDAKFMYGSESEITFGWNAGKPSQEASTQVKKTGFSLLNRVTLSKQITRSNRLHTQIAHLTFTESGKLVKLVVSR
jgi:hypothetical protein